jgi:hypothetical protein
MKLVLRFMGLMLLCLLPQVLAAQNPAVDWVHGTDFSRIHTFTWATGPYPIQDADARLGMARAVQSELESKGVQWVDPQQKFDIFVTYNALIETDVNDSSRKIISLRLRIFDSSNNNVIWRAGGSVAMVNDVEQNRSNLRALLDSMFEQYPPSE